MKVHKATSEQWLQIHREAHKKGLRTPATMLYGSIETKEERLQHMISLRSLQEETRGFQVFIPLAVQPIHKNAGIKMNGYVNKEIARCQSIRMKQIGPQAFKSTKRIQRLRKKDNGCVSHPRRIRVA